MKQLKAKNNAEKMFIINKRALKMSYPTSGFESQLAFSSTFRSVISQQLIYTYKTVTFLHLFLHNTKRIQVQIREGDRQVDIVANLISGKTMNVTSSQRPYKSQQTAESDLSTAFYFLTKNQKEKKNSCSLGQYLMVLHFIYFIFRFVFAFNFIETPPGYFCHGSGRYNAYAAGCKSSSEFNSEIEQGQIHGEGRLM